MPVHIGQLDVIAAPRPAARGEEGSDQQPALKARDVAQILDDAQWRQLRRMAD